MYTCTSPRRVPTIPNASPSGAADYSKKIVDSQCLSTLAHSPAFGARSEDVSAPQRSRNKKLLAEIDHEFGLDNSSQDEQDISNDVDDVIFDDVSFDDVSINDVEFDVVDFDVGMNGLDFEQEIEEVLYISHMIVLALVETQDVSDLFDVYDQPIDDEGGVVPSEVVAKEMVSEEIVDGDDEDVIPTEVYDVMVAQEMLKDQVGDVIPVDVVAKNKVVEETVLGSSSEDGDVVIPHELYAAMVAAEGFLYTKDGDVVIPNEVYDAMVAQEILEDQTRAIKRRRVMADKEDKDNAE
ncbi:hypothetical protein Tco_1338673 [Tanacetum coccineum]